MAEEKHSTIFDSDDDEPEKIISPAVKNNENDKKVLRSTPQFRHTPKKETPPQKEVYSPKIIPDTPKSPVKHKSRIPSYINRTPLPPDDDEEYISKKVNSLMARNIPPDYDEYSEEIKLACYEKFREKFNTLKVNYPDKGIPDFPEERSITTVHKTYRSILKDIWVSANLSQMKTYYIIALMAIEFLCVKFLGLPMAGFFKMQIKSIYKYELMLIELGHEYYTISGGGGDSENGWGIGYRLAFSLAFNIVVFLVLKFAMKYFNFENEGFMEVIKGYIDNLSVSNSSSSDIESGNIETEDKGVFENFGGDMIYNKFSDITKNIEKEQGKSKPAQKAKKFTFADD